MQCQSCLDLCRRLIYSDFLESLDEASFFTNRQPSLGPTLVPSSPYTSTNTRSPATTQPTQQSTFSPSTPATTESENANQCPEPSSSETSAGSDSASVLASTKTERFLMTAADQESGSRDERLKRVIRTKYEAGLLKPYNYVKGYARLSRWMDRKCVV